MTTIELMREINDLEKMLLFKAKQAAASILAEEPNKPLQQIAKAAVIECNAEFFTSMFDGIELALWLWLNKNAEMKEGA